MRFLFVAIASLLCANPALASSAVYRCALNIDVVADYAPDGKSVTLHIQGKTLTLPIAMSGSGARYSDGKSTIWEHQGTAQFDVPGASFTDCKAVRLNR